MMARILIVEDEDKLRRVLSLQLESAGYEVESVGSAEAALRLLDRASLVLTDLRLPAMDGLALLESIQRQSGHPPVVVMTAFGTVEIAVEAMKKGAADFLPKPFSMDHLMAVVRKALEVQSLREENTRLKEELGQRYRFENIVGSGPKMQEILAAILRVGPMRTTVLLCGESGVGKDLIARAIHHHSPRSAHPFVKINCTAIPENLMESELFGYEKGAFTGAATSKPGKFEQADGGTVFLDEIGDVPTAVQVKLLRILQEREFERLGSNKTRQIDVRVIAATNVDLRRALEEGNFREDLYYRLNVFPLTIPSLRERAEDIPILAENFLRKFARELGSQVEGLSEAACEKLMAYHWPGNVRELENAIERSLLYATGTQLQPEDIRLDHAPRRAVPGNGGNGNGSGLVSDFLPEGISLEEHEQQLIREALRRAAGNKSQAARLLGLSRNALRYRLSQMGLE
ncbi:sigma-54 dependent transcriptional regulator [uncultured Paludibaculum sp.]|uniref:sigma-54-dependent transcriptional regulator n=1 Tax=uncultured Paludibaculum sp. TaxID=1765020 RepID=UPI002AAC3DC4|nr:sigma-54 dependent transcriptional regulator [uncultured Paludibaculum sp.]